MPSRTYLIEVTDGGQVFIGAIDRVTRTVTDRFDDTGAVRWIKLEGRILGTDVRPADEAAVLFAAGAIRAQVE